MTNKAGISAGRAEHPAVYFSPSYLDLDDSIARDIMLPQEEQRTLYSFFDESGWGNKNSRMDFEEGGVTNSVDERRGMSFYTFP